MDMVVTVCGSAAGGTCPMWPGAPLRAHWGVEDPAAVSGTEAEIAVAFRQAFAVLEHRIKAFVALPIASLEQLALKQHMDRIGTSLPDAPIT